MIMKQKTVTNVTNDNKNQFISLFYIDNSYLFIYFMKSFNSF